MRTAFTTNRKESSPVTTPFWREYNPWTIKAHKERLEAARLRRFKCRMGISIKTGVGLTANWNWKWSWCRYCGNCEEFLEFDTVSRRGFEQNCTLCFKTLAMTCLFGKLPPDLPVIQDL